MSDIQVSISAVKTVNLGSHGERQTTVYEYIPGETIEDLVRRVLHEQFESFYRNEPSDKIVLKVVVGADGKIMGAGTPSEEPPF